MPKNSDSLMDTAGRIASGDVIDWSELGDQEAPDARVIKNLQTIAALAERYSGTSAELSPGSGHEGRNSPPLKAVFSWGHLQIKKMIGAGGFGEVFCAYDPVLCRDVALKLRSESARDGSAARLFIDEARRMALVRHPNVLAIHGADVRDSRAGLWAELLSGETLEQSLSKHGPLPHLEVLKIMQSIASALDAIRNAGLIHGDVKASNVMIEDDGRVVLMDFGAAGDIAEHAATHTFVSPLSAAPELFDGKPASSASDQYSLGVLLHRLIYGHYPLDTKSFDELLLWHEARKSGETNFRPDSKSPFAQLVRQLLRVDPQTRPGTIECLQELRRIESQPARRRKTAIVAAIILSLALGTIAASIGFLQATRSEARTAQTASELQSVNDFLQSALASPRPTSSGRQSTVMELLERAAARVETDLTTHPAAQARTLYIIGDTYEQMGLSAEAQPLLERSLQLRENTLGENDPDTLLSRAKLAETLANQQKLDEADATLTPVFAVLSNVTLQHPVQEQSRFARGRIAYHREQYASAVSHFEELVAFRSDPEWRDQPMYWAAKLELANVLEVTGEYSAALQVASDALQWHLRRYGERHQLTLSARQQQAIVHDRMGQPLKTYELMSRNLDVLLEWLGEDDQYTFRAMINVAASSYGADLIDEAIERQEYLQEIKHRFTTPDSVMSLSMENNYAGVLRSRATGREEAEQILTALLPRIEDSLGPNHRLLAISQVTLTLVLYELKRPSEAIRQGEQTRQTVTRAFDDSHPLIYQADALIGAAYVDLGEYARAEEILRSSLAAQTELFGDAGSETLTTHLYLTRAVRGRDASEANAMLELLLVAYTEAYGSDHSETQSVREEITKYQHQSPPSGNEDV